MSYDIILPMIEEPSKPLKLAKRLDTLTNKKVAIFWNHKPGGDHILKRIQRHLETLGAKTSFSMRAETRKEERRTWYGESLQAIKENDAIVFGVGDCGACTAMVVIWGGMFEASGIPTVCVATDEFANLGAMISTYKGIPYLPIVTVKHPVYFDSEEKIIAKTEPVLDEVVHILTTPPETIEKEYAYKWFKPPYEE